MIEEIYIRDLGVIKEARLQLGSGLTVLTGETGAGKTMVLSALGLLLGERADTAAIRKGQDQAFVEGRWLLANSQPIAERLAEAGAELDDQELIMNRSISAEGRSRAAVGGRATPISVLNEIGEQLVVVHGQSEQIRLKSAAAQREALDQFAGSATLLAEYQTHYQAWRKAAATLDDVQNNQQQMISEANSLREAVAELEAASPQPGEDVEIADQINRLTHLEELRNAATAAHEALSSESFQDSGDAMALIGQARRSLEHVANHDSKLEQLAESLKQLGYQLNEVAAEISGYLASLDDDSSRALEHLQERKALLNNLKRKYGPTLDDVINYSNTASDRLLQLDSSNESLEALQQKVDDAFAAMQISAAALSARRIAAAKELAQQVGAELAALAMAGASLVVEVTEAADFNAHGKDSIAILLAAHPGAEPRPLGKGASGGELSRIMLALEVVLAKTEQAPTFIFDEVDAGVGGAAAIEVGRRLAMLAKQTQVIVVTHLAQVAAYANNHLQVLKTSGDEFTATDVRSLDEQSRVAELARMLSGLPDSDSGRAHAAELLQKAKAEFA